MGMVAHPTVAHSMVAHPMVVHPMVAHSMVAHPMVAHPMVAHSMVVHPFYPLHTGSRGSRINVSLRPTWSTIVSTRPARDM